MEVLNPPSLPLPSPTNTRTISRHLVEIDYRFRSNLSPSPIPPLLPSSLPGIKFNKYNCSKNEALLVWHVARTYPDNYFSIHFLSPQPRYSRGIRYIQLTLYRTSTCGAGREPPPRVFSTVPRRESNSFPGHRPAFFAPATAQLYEVNMRFAVAYDFNSAGAHRFFPRSQSSSDRDNG